MNKKIIIGVGIVIGIAIIISIISFQMEIDSNKIQEGYSTYPDNPQTVGSLTINKDKYMIGEVVFVSMELNPLENGHVEFYNQDEKLFYKFKFNGSADQSPNLYFRPMLENRYNICTVNDLIGTWTVKISGVTLNDKKTGLTIEPREMQFDIIDEIISGDVRFENWTQDVCDKESVNTDSTNNSVDVPPGSGTNP